MITTTKREEVEKIFNIFFDCNFSKFSAIYFEKRINEIKKYYVQLLFMPLFNAYIVTVLFKNKEELILKKDNEFSKNFKNEDEAIEYFEKLKRRL